MKEEDWIEAIEELNEELQRTKKSKEYKIGKNYLKYRSLIKKFHFIQALKLYINSKRKKIEVTIEKQNFYKETKLELGKDIKKDVKIAVYYNVVSNYDYIREPLIKPNNVDYILFTDQPEFYEKSKKFIIKRIPEKILKLNHGVLINRYIKMHPKELLEGYDYAIYVDGNIRIISDIHDLLLTINEKTGLSIHRHHIRKCIYDEAKACKIRKKGNYQKIKEQVKKYKKEGFPSEFGMLEAGIIVSNLKNKTAEDILELWWEEFYETQSMRDQLSLPYVLWKNHYNLEDIGFLGSDIGVNKKWQYYEHQRK